MGFTASQKVEFEKLYNVACDASEARLVQLKDSMLELMIESGVARIKYLPPKCVVPHPKNRGGSQMQWRKIFQKGSKIISVGVSLQECGPNKAVAFDVGKDAALAHISLCKTSVHYPSFTDPEAVEAGSVGCGHWNQFLACIHDKVEVPKEFQAKLCEVGYTRLDPQRLCRDQPALKPLITQGLQFTLIKSGMEAYYPQLPHILQKALNVEHHIGEGQRMCVCVCVCVHVYAALRGTRNAQLTNSIHVLRDSGIY